MRFRLAAPKKEWWDDRRRFVRNGGSPEKKMSPGGTGKAVVVRMTDGEKKSATIE